MKISILKRQQFFRRMLKVEKRFLLLIVKCILNSFLIRLLIYRTLADSENNVFKRLSVRN